MKKLLNSYPGVNDFFKNKYREINEGFERKFVYKVHGKGLYLELRRIANCMVYALDQELQFVMDETNFAYKFDKGWTDYFNVFYPIHEEGDSERVEMTFPDSRAFNAEVSWYKCEKLSFGSFEIQDRDLAKKLFVMMVFDLKNNIKTDILKFIDKIEIPEKYIAVQIRRGEKLINGEGEYHAGKLYLEPLLPIDPNTGIFVMTDDYVAVQEVTEYLKSINYSNKVITFVTERYKGIHFKEYMEEIQDTSTSSTIYTETIQLLAETIIVANSDFFVGAYDTNVAHGLRYLHLNPSQTKLI